MNRRAFNIATAGLLPGLAARLLSARQAPVDPWSRDELLEPSALSTQLTDSKSAPAVICVAFPVLYRQKHIKGAVFAGPTNKPEGIQALKGAVAKLEKSSEVVIYCGCCPMGHCPNIRPAFTTLKGLGFTEVRVLNLPQNFHTDWVSKGYPVSAES